MIKESYLMVDALAQRDNLFTRTDARIKVALSILAFAAILGFLGFKFPTGIFILTVAAMLFIKTPAKLMVGRILAPMVLGTAVFLFLLFFQGGYPIFTVHIFGLKLVGYREGLLLGTTVLTRIAASVSLLLLLSVTTPIHELGYALIWMRFPKVIVEIMLLTYRYLFVLWDEGLRIRQAQILRMGYPNRRSLDGWKLSLKSTSTLMGMVFIRAYDRAESTFSAMQVRAYNGNMTGNHYEKWNKSQTKFFVSGLVVLLALAAISI